MKKILLATVAAAALSTSSAYANTNEGTFYLKANAGWDKLTAPKANYNGITAINGVRGITGGKFKSGNDAYFGVGAGYYVMDNARFDLTFDHLFNPNTKSNGTINLTPAAIAAGYTDIKFNSKVKSTVNSLLLNGYMDLGTIDAFKFFVGAGLGVSQVSAKQTTTINSNVPGIPANTNLKAKSKYNLAYAGHVGVAYELAPGITGELAYSYRYLGKSKDFGNVKGSAITYKGHFVGAGVRFDI